MALKFFYRVLKVDKSTRSDFDLFSTARSHLPRHVERVQVPERKHIGRDHPERRSGHEAAADSEHANRQKGNAQADLWLGQPCH